MALTIQSGITVEGGITVGNVPMPEPTGSLLFNGSNQYLSMTPGFALGTGAYTIEGWFYNTGSYAVPTGLVGTDQSGTQTVTNNGTVTQSATKPF